MRYSLTVGDKYTIYIYRFPLNRKEFGISDEEIHYNSSIEEP